jgi:hypothetical protein
MSMRSIGLVALAASAQLALGCADGAPPTADRAGGSRGPAGSQDLSSAAAVVDGEVIGVDQVRALMDASDAGLTAEEAVEALVDEQLLANEAARRGFGGPDVAVERERAIVRRLMKKIRDGVTVADIDPKKVSEAYEAQKQRFVHGPLRGVIHAVALAKSRGGPDAAAKALAEVIGAAVSGAASADEFEERARRFQSREGVKVRIERLPDFAADDGRFEKAFVDAAFAVPKVGGISPPFKTSYGWHVLYVIRDLPAEDVPFAEARAQLAAELLPAERQRRIDELLDRLARDKEVFLYDFPTAPAGERPAP